MGVLRVSSNSGARSGTPPPACAGGTDNGVCDQPCTLITSTTVQSTCKILRMAISRVPSLQHVDDIDARKSSSNAARLVQYPPESRAHPVLQSSHLAPPRCRPTASFCCETGADRNATVQAISSTPPERPWRIAPSGLVTAERDGHFLSPLQTARCVQESPEIRIPMAVTGRFLRRRFPAVCLLPSAAVRRHGGEIGSDVAHVSI